MLLGSCVMVYKSPSHKYTIVFQGTRKSALDILRQLKFYTRNMFHVNPLIAMMCNILYIIYYIKHRIYKYFSCWFTIMFPIFVHSSRKSDSFSINIDLFLSLFLLNVTKIRFICRALCNMGFYLSTVEDDDSDEK